jgi:hypothetical protein
LAQTVNEVVPEEDEEAAAAQETSQADDAEVSSFCMNGIIASR